MHCVHPALAPSLPGFLNLTHSFVNCPFIKLPFTFLSIVGQSVSMELGIYQFDAGREPLFHLSLLPAGALEFLP